MPSVLQDWVTELPLMMQGTMMTGIRGNDLDHAPKMKPVVRFIRAQILVQGNPENDFMEIQALPAVEDFEDELEYMTVHYFRHFLHTLEIIGYKHPDYTTADIAMDYYLRLVNWCHLAPESHEELDERLSGKPGTTGTSKVWPGVTGIVPSRKKKATKKVSVAAGHPIQIKCNYCTNSIAATHTLCPHCLNDPRVYKSPAHTNYGGNSY